MAGFLSEKDGQGSSTRLVILLVVLFYLGCSIYLVGWGDVKTIPDLPATLMGLLAMLYGVNKIGPNINIGKGS